MMKSTRFSRIRPRTPFAVLAALGSLGVLGAVGCSDDPAGSTGVDQPRTVEMATVVNSVDLSLTVFQVDQPDSLVTLGLGPDGSPVGVSVRGNLAAVPMGLLPAVVIVDLAVPEVLFTVALPAGSGATGSAFLNDSIVLVANPGLNSVTPVNVRTGSAGPQVSVGTFPQAIVVAGDEAFVVNANLESFVPIGPGSLTVLDAGSLAVEATIGLSGLNPAGAVVGPSGLLYVVNSGEFFGNNGSLSAVSPSQRTEVGHFTGFGDFPGAAAFAPGDRLLVSAFSFGVAVWDVQAESFVRSPESAIAPGGVGSASGVGVDSQGRIYALAPDCQGPSQVHRLGPDFEIEESIPVGTCPISIAFSEVVID